MQNNHNSKSPCEAPSLPTKSGFSKFVAILVFGMVVGYSHPAHGQNLQWEMMVSGTDADFGRDTPWGTNALSVWNSSFILVAGRDPDPADPNEADLVLIYDGSSWQPFFDSINNPFSAYTEGVNVAQSGVAISSPETIYFGGFGAVQATSRRVFRTDIGPGGVLDTTSERPTGSNDRIRDLWTNPDPSNTRVVAAIQRGAGLPGLWWSDDGESWTVTLDDQGDPLIAGVFNEVHGSSSSNIFALNNDNEIFHSTNGGVSVSAPISPDTTNQIWGIFTLENTALWAVGQSGEVHFWDGIEFTEQATPTSNTLTSVHAFALDDVWAVGLGNTVLHYNGLEWTLVDTGIPGSFDLFDIGADENGFLYVVGSDGVILRAIPEPSTALLLGLGSMGFFLLRRRIP